MSARSPLSSGAGRVLVIVYGVLALAATGRSAYQLLTKAEEAPLAYSLSLLAALVYIVATIALLARGAAWYRIAVAAVGFELLGVLAVGALSLAVPALFAHASVWSWFGLGYGFIPLVLPFLGLAWLWHRRPRPEAAGVAEAPASED